MITMNKNEYIFIKMINLKRSKLLGMNIDDKPNFVHKL